MMCGERELRRVAQAEHGEAEGREEVRPMPIATCSDRGTEQILLEGDLDHGACEEIATSLDEAVSGEAGTVVLRMEGVRSICSRGVSVLLAAYHRLRREGRTLLVTDLRPQVRDVLD